MDCEVYGDIVACLPQGRTLFAYERDHYAVHLLDYLLAAGWSAQRLRSSPFARLLEKPPVREILATTGRADFSRRHLALAFMRDPVIWRLTVGRWEAERRYQFRQTSRRGSNIVLQLNFTAQHNHAFRELLSPTGATIFAVDGHPVSTREHTMAWSRIDLDLDTGEALIEEVQCDWVRQARRAATYPRHFHRRNATTDETGDRIYPRERFEAGVKTYYDKVLPRYADGWEETIMAATLFFIVRELGIRTIYMHAFDTGNALKHITGRWDGKPPRSLYTDLPRRFCFSLGTEGPTFLSAEIARIARGKHRVPVNFWRLRLGNDTVQQLPPSRIP
ncbi:hypothetical protein [Mesorhizobium sp. WSM2561]|uniref:hypothetical protein n=1 Tax=Mesorhizobium sp. WSM2561 TaxID=1040985 RepID=UPI000482E98C|nr:hypothetical protein [Mesorhizobium sp. WSM2561]